MAVNPSKNLNALVPYKGKGGTDLVSEKIDERILRLLGLEDVFDIDYDTYISLLRERMASARMSKQSIPTEEVELITEEWKRIKKKNGRFRIKKITAESFKKGSSVGIQLGKQKFLNGLSISSKKLALPPAINKMSGGNDIEDIKNALAEIISNLTIQNKDQKKILERQRFDSEKERRASREALLEKGFSKAISAAQKMLAPVKSLLDKIIDAIVAIFIGRSIVKLIEWFSNPDNKEKVKSIFKFLGEHWPKLLALYLRFGTGLGRFIGGLSSLLIKGTLRLVQVAARLAARAGLKGAGKVAGFLGGRGGKFLGAGLEVAATVGSTMALSKGIENFSGFKFAGGGLANFKKFFGFSGGGTRPGYISGQKGIDKIPAMLSDGEFVMSRGAVEKYGTDTLEAMNAAGGGTNRPRMISGTTYAAGGGQIGTRSVAPSLSGNEKIAYNQLQMNFPTAKPYHIAAALGNFSVEAPGLKPNTAQYGGGPGRGVAQWETPGRWDTAVKRYGPGIFNSLSQQMDYVKYEMDTGNPDSQGRPQLPWGRNAKSSWLGSKNLIEATKNFMIGYEAPGVPHESERIASAKRILNSGSPASSNIAANPKVQPTQKPNIFQRLGSGVASIFGLNQPAKAEPIIKSKPKPRFAGGLAPDSSQRKSSSIPTLTFSASKSRASQRNISAPMNLMPEIVYEVVAPSTTKPSGGGTGGSPQIPSFSNVHASNNAGRNAKLLGVR
jgi:hypothetical protein